MGSDFLNIPSKEDITLEEENNNIQEKEKQKINKRKPKKKRNNKDNDKENSESIQNKIKEDNSNLDNSNISNTDNDISDNSEISQNNDYLNKNKKKIGRKKKKKEKIAFYLEEELPDPENLDNVGLSLEMKKYGMKPQNKKRNIEILKNVYKFLKIKELPENVSKNLASFDLAIDEKNADSENDNKIGNRKKDDNSNIIELSDEQKKK